MVEPDTLRALQHENARLKETNRTLRDELIRLRHAIRALKELQDSLQTISPDSDVLALLNRILSRALTAVDSENGSLLLLDEETEELVFVVVHGPYRGVLTGHRLEPGTGIVGWVVANRRPELIPDARQEPRFAASVDQLTGLRTTALICVPLMYGDRVWGAIEVVNTRSGEAFTEEDLDVMMLVARLAAEALSRAEEAV